MPMTTIEIDRTKVCPMLLRVFCREYSHNSMSDYSRGNTPTHELQVHTWMNATLAELAGLVQQVNTESKRRGTLFDFNIVYPDPKSPAYRSREFGTFCAGVPGAEDKITLQDRSFCIGDYLDVAITPPDTEPQAPVMRSGRRPQSPARWRGDR